MRIIYPTKRGEKEFSSEAGFLLNNKFGNFLTLNNPNISHYQGLNVFYDHDWKYVKFIESIGPNEPCDKLVYMPNNVERHYRKVSESFILSKDYLVYEFDGEKEQNYLDLDIRYLYDYDTNGRKYKIVEKNESGIIVEYEKENGYKFYFGITGIKNYELIEKWTQKEYAYDESRGQESKRWIYRLLEIIGPQKIIFSWGRTIDELKNKIKHFSEPEKIKNWNAELIDDLYGELACTSLNNSIIHTEKRTGIYAGYPWFFQFWARDELISLGGLIEQGRYEQVHEIIHFYLDNILPDGRLSNMFPPSTLGSADAIGWLFYRIKHFFEKLDHEMHLSSLEGEHKDFAAKYTSVEEKEKILDKLEYSIGHMNRNYLKNNLIHADKLETWMDTFYGDDKREGACIELQAMHLNMYDMAKELSKELKRKEMYNYTELKNNMINALKEMVKDDLIQDVLGKNIIRPNFFIAAYIYPEMLQTTEWTKLIKKMIGSIWLSWGGLSSIDISHPLYCAEYTGENNKSYHRGDSWYFINNISAIVMHRINKQEFDKYIQSIYFASANDLVKSGWAGHISELSYSRKQKPAGCFAQSWSTSTFIELKKELGH